MLPPTLAQQRGFAFAPMPFAVTSFISSSYVIYHILYKEREILKRLYHRLVLAMNFALLPLSFISIWGTFSVPEGTPYYVGASGTIQTCTAQGFIALMFSLTVPTYYGSLSLQALMAIKNNFKEKKYCWIEKWIHLVAWGIPCAFASVLAATENFNPNGTGCYYAKAPRGCETDPDVTCQRGKDLGYFWFLSGFSHIFLYFVFPPSVIIAMYCWIGRVHKKMEGSRGMARVKQNARKQMMTSIAKQVSLYLFSFLSTIMFSLFHAAYQLLTKEILYNLLIFANCIFASQGFVFALVYFTLQRQGQPKVECVNHGTSTSLRRELTVEDIRSKAKGKSQIGLEVANDRRESYDFNIFDGAPDENSPWARYIDQDDDDCSDDHCESAGTPNGGETPINDDIETQ